MPGKTLWYYEYPRFIKVKYLNDVEMIPPPKRKWFLVKCNRGETFSDIETHFYETKEAAVLGVIRSIMENAES